MIKHDVLIIGAGASGCLSSILLKEGGIDCGIIDSQDRILKKILTTGNGRCNISNVTLKDTDRIKDFYSSSDPQFRFEPVLNFGVGRTLSIFRSLGVPVTELEDGKLYPMSLQASSVSDMLRLKMKELGVAQYTGEKILKVTGEKNGFKINSEKEVYFSNNLIVSTGGLAMPSTGSDGSFNRHIRSLGHTIVTQLPALVQLKCDFKSLKAISGVKQDCRVTLTDGKNILFSQIGELLFTDYGISGPPVLQMSRFASHRLKTEELYVKTDLFPLTDRSEISEFVKDQIRKNPDREASELFQGFLNKKLIPVLLKASGLEKMNTKARDIEEKVVETFIDYLKDWTMKITDTNGFNNAQSTLGGVSMKEVNHRTLESLIVPGLYFTGEVLDVCGACGGFNLQWAWSSAQAVVSDILS